MRVFSTQMPQEYDSWIDDNASMDDELGVGEAPNK